MKIGTIARISDRHFQELIQFFSIKELIHFPICQTLPVTKRLKANNETYYKLGKYSLWIHEQNLTEVKNDN